MSTATGGTNMEIDVAPEGKDQTALEFTYS